MEKKSVIIIGAGIAGLSTGVYAQLNGYQSRIFEMHTVPGGLMTAWKRKGFVIDGCIHWLTGSSKDFPEFYDAWEDIGLIQGREILDPEIFLRWETADGKVLNLYTDINKLEQHLLELAPEDRRPILEFTRTVRSFIGRIPKAPSGARDALPSLIKLLPQLPRMMKWGGMSMGKFASKFSNPLLRTVFAEMWYPEMSAVGLIFTLAMLHQKGAGYPIGGSLPMARGVEERYCALGGQIEYGARVSQILTEELPGGKGSKAVGIRLEDGREVRADYVISAADGHATLTRMLGDRFTTPQFKEMYASAQIFPPILLMGFGVDRTFPDLPAITGGVAIELAEPVQVADTPIKRLDSMIYNFDPTMAPAGKTVVTIMAPTSYTYWKDLYNEGEDHERYEAEKERVAMEVIHRLDQRFPGFSAQVEMADVATPVTFERYTGNWQGSFEGWIPTVKSVTKPIPKTLPGLNNFYMAGQWVSAGGGLPSGIMTGKDVVQRLCKQDGKKFQTRG